jgi:hypothetical protein
MRPWRRRKETLGVFSLYAKRYKSVYISVNNNTNLNFLKILSNYIIWDRLSQKTISRYCPFKHLGKQSFCILFSLGRQGQWLAVQNSNDANGPLMVFFTTVIAWTHGCTDGGWTRTENTSASKSPSDVFLRPLGQFCGSRIFIPDPNFFDFIHPGSWISDPTKARKEKGEKMCCLTFCVSHMFQKIQNYFMF